MKKLISPKELAEYLGISINSLAVWRTNKTYPIPYIKVGGKIRYDLDDINQWLNNRKNNIISEGDKNDR